MLRKRHLKCLLIFALSLTVLFHPVAPRAQNTSESYEALSEKIKELGKKADILTAERRAAEAERQFSACEAAGNAAVFAALRPFPHQDDEKAQALGDRGLSNFRSGRYQHVVTDFNAYLNLIEPRILRKEIFPDDPSVDMALGLVINAYIQLSRPDLLEQALKRHIEITERSQGYDYPSLSAYLALLAQARQARGRADEATALFNRSADIAQNALERGSPRLDPHDWSRGNPGPETKALLLDGLLELAALDAKPADYAAAEQRLGFVIRFIEKDPDKHLGELLKPLN